MLPIQPYTFRPSKLIFLILIGMCLLYGIFLFEQGGVKRNEYAIVLSAIFLVAYSILAMKRLKIYIDNDGILHQKIFSTTFINWQDIIASDIVIEAHGHAITPRWVFQTKNNKSYKMDMPYGKKNIRILAEALVMRAPAARLTNKIINLSKGEDTSLFLD